MRSVFVATIALAGLTSLAALAQTPASAPPTSLHPESGARAGHVPGVGVSLPRSDRASNIRPSDTRPVAPTLPAPAVGADATVRTYLRAARTALVAGRTGDGATGAGDGGDPGARSLGGARTNRHTERQPSRCPHRRGAAGARGRRSRAGAAPDRCGHRHLIGRIGPGNIVGGEHSLRGCGTGHTHDRREGRDRLPLREFRSCGLMAGRSGHPESGVGGAGRPPRFGACARALSRGKSECSGERIVLFIINPGTPLRNTRRTPNAAQAERPAPLTEPQAVPDRIRGRGRKWSRGPRAVVPAHR